MSISKSFKERAVRCTALPLTLPAAADNDPGIAAIGQQTSWLFLGNLLPHKMLLHLRDTGTSLAEGPAELP